MNCVLTDGAAVKSSSVARISASGVCAVSTTAQAELGSFPSWMHSRGVIRFTLEWQVSSPTSFRHHALAPFWTCPTRTSLMVCAFASPCLLESLTDR